ncbi:NAD(P)-dependent oxidoreductase [Actinomyces culturomici]|uniref:NAD(P)-dependent oxidoreductase n=1 Tax=Actinomyces culturomici TaxID=1926276 RepID=UPI000E20B3FD|nr:NAD(P)H-binding protein [Actinomyces culturomici]
MRITVIGGTGQTGSAVVAEAARRGHVVTSVTRSGTPAEGAATNLSADVTNAEEIARLIDDSDATILAIGGLGETATQIYRDLVAAKPTGYFIIVGGAGSLRDENGDRLVDSPPFPDAWKPEALAYADVLEDLRATDESIRWGFIFPAPFYPVPESTGAYVESLDTPAGQTLSAADIALALVDEAEKGAHVRERFTVASAPQE